MWAGLQRHLPTCRLQNELLTLSVGRTFKSEHQTEPNTLTVPVLADINLTKEVFQKEENDHFARLSVLEGNLSAISGGGDAGNNPWPYPVPLQRLVEEAVNTGRHRNERRISHEWQLVLSSCWQSNFWVWHGHLLCSEGSLDQPCKPYADLTQHQQPERASRLVLGISQPNTTRQWGRQSTKLSAYPESSSDITATPDQQSSVARKDTAAAAESETALYSVHGQMCVCMSPRWRRASIN